ncbi:MAG: hypothetical protein ACTHMC_02745 [Pseudobacter sp.]|uniref:hypothetical protein n=1 Tax=Pseudobacter sp. TaxID=2045420 RepID=UPI003F81F46F
MKNVFYKASLAMILLSAGPATAQDWKPLGDPITRNNKIALSITTTGKAYTAYDNTMNGLNVKSFDGKSWAQVGKPDFTGTHSPIFDLATDQEGIPYVAYRCVKKGTTGEKAWVEKFDGKQWVAVGPDAISTGSVNDITLAFDNNNKLYCAFADYKRQKLAIMQLDNNNWVELASPQDQSTCDEITLKFTSTNVPVICYADTKNGKKVTVKSFDGTKWTLTGSAPASDKEGKYINMSLDSKGHPVVAYQYTWDGKILVNKFDGKAWTKVGEPVFDSYNDNISMTLDAQDSPVVAYHVNKGNSPIEVKRFNGSSWTKLSDAGLGSYYTSIINYKGTLYITFQENGKGGVVKQLSN